MNRYIRNMQKNEDGQRKFEKRDNLEALDFRGD